MTTVFTVIEIIGICSFSLSGAIIGIRKHLDAFGVLLCSLFTSFGGGLVRDVLLGNYPPLVFRNYLDLCFAVASFLVTFLFAYKNKRHFEEDTPVIDKINNFVDAMGLGLFTIIGINTAIDCGYASNGPFVVFLGMTTAIGGGMIRDIVIREVPFVLSKRIYAVASILGGIVYYMMYIYFKLGYIPSIITGILVIFLTRILASVFEWDLPKAF